MERAFADHGFLPDQDPLKEFPRSSPLAVLDDLGHDLPSLLQDAGFRERAAACDPAVDRAREPAGPIAANAVVLRAARILGRSLHQSGGRTARG